ncbi:TerD family protein [Bacillus mycoides]|uniref:TerD family protein n=1 Tax=Bacillus mycoides TaxID=1405 RepID=UPI0011AA085F
MPITLTIYHPQAPNQNFQQLTNPFTRLPNQQTNQELLRFHLAQHFSIQTPVLFSQLYPHNPHSNFNPLPTPFQPPLPPLLTPYPFHP